MSDLTTLIFTEHLQTIIARHAEVRKAASDLLQSEFKKVIVMFFTHCPEVNVIKWTQYTPYFNDGDTCEFSVNDPVFSNTTDVENLSVYGEYGGDDADVWCECGSRRMNDAPAHLHEYIRALDKFLLSKELESVMKDVFGDHATVTVTREGIEVEEYDHD